MKPHSLIKINTSGQLQKATDTKEITAIVQLISQEPTEERIKKMIFSTTANVKSMNNKIISVADHQIAELQRGIVSCKQILLPTCEEIQRFGIMR
ncbi:MAG: hypothetical protein FWC10_03730 [Lentimicrobiaceae bacterium]|nr:hypothetical protein [Lentimicrobiaceae bacterium]